MAIVTPPVLEVVVDVDDVLSGQVKNIHERARKKYPGASKLKFKNYTHLNYSDLWGVSAPEAHEFVIEYLSDSLNLELVPGGYERLRNMREVARQQGKDVHYSALTSRSERLEEATRRQLHHFFPGIFEDRDIFVTGHAEPQAPRYSKLHYYRNVIGGHVIIDDGVKNVRECIEGAGGLGVVFGKHPWNPGRFAVPDAGSEPQVPGIYRCIDWAETEQLILRAFFPNVT